MRCPCHSSLEYHECCQAYHNKKELPESALCLMRSRYSAYALELPDYIIETTHPDNPLYLPDKKMWRESILKFCNETTFVGLNIIEFVESEHEAFVSFIAHLKQNSSETFLREKSFFHKSDDKWLYSLGKVEN